MTRIIIKWTTARNRSVLKREKKFYVFFLNIFKCCTIVYGS